MLCWEASISLPGKHPSRLKWQAKACKKPAFNPLSSGTIQVPQQLPQPCGIAVLLLPGELLQLSLGAGEGDGAAPLGSRGNQSQPGSSEIPHQIPSLTPKAAFTAHSLEKQGITHLGHIQQLHSGMLQVPGAGTHRCAQMWGKGMTNCRTTAGFVLLKPSPAELQVPPIPSRQRARV